MNYYVLDYYYETIAKLMFCSAMKSVDILKMALRALKGAYLKYVTEESLELSLKYRRLAFAPLLRALIGG